MSTLNTLYCLKLYTRIVIQGSCLQQPHKCYGYVGWWMDGATRLGAASFFLVIRRFCLPACTLPS